jgi:hypothetical protein
VVALPEITPTDGSCGMRWEQKGLAATMGQGGAAYSLGNIVAVRYGLFTGCTVSMHTNTLSFHDVHLSGLTPGTSG